MHALLIEDDKNLCEILYNEFNKRNISLDMCYDGEDALFYGKNQSYDVIILDRMLPSKDGLTILKELRNENITTPIIIVTAMDTVNDRIDGLDNGADDYLVKPFALEELFARIRALTRRPSQILDQSILKIANIVLDTNQYILKSDENQCTISKRECDLLAFFILNKNLILKRELIISRVWGAASEVTDSNLDNFICFLRKRLKLVKCSITLKTVRGIGYRLDE